MKFKSNIPNKITIIRVILIPLFAIVLLADVPHPYKNRFAAFIFAMLSISDFFDGYIARKKRQVTEFGKLIDPIADKLLVSTALIFLIGRGVEFWMAASIIAREVIVTAIRIYMLPSKIIVPASSFGKAKTVVQSIAIVFVLLSLPFSRHIMIAAVLLTLISGIEYLIRIKRMTNEKIVNMPNAITLTRLLLVIPFIYFVMKPNNKAALLIFVAIVSGDLLDGISARIGKYMTNLGSIFDSLTDWILISATLIAFIKTGYVSAVEGIILIVPLALNLPLNAAIKMRLIKSGRQILTPALTKITVGLGNITILAFLTNFAYKGLFLTASIVMLYLTFANFIARLLMKS